MYMLTKRTSVFVIGALCLLLIPFLAMQFGVQGWDWHLFDYLVVGVLLVGVGFALAAATNSAFSLKRRVIAIGIVALLLVFYIHVAVGIVDWLPFAGS